MRSPTSCCIRMIGFLSQTPEMDVVVMERTNRKIEDATQRWDEAG